MTSTIMTRDGNWGERRAAEKAGRQRRRTGWLIAAPVLLILATPLVSEAVNAVTDSDAGWRYPHVAVAVMGSILLGLALWFSWRNWQERDEVERRITVNSWAAMGVASLLLHPLLRLAQPALHLHNPDTAAWLGSIVVALIAGAWQHARARV